MCDLRLRRLAGHRLSYLHMKTDRNLLFPIIFLLFAAVSCGGGESAAGGAGGAAAGEMPPMPVEMVTLEAKPVEQMTEFAEL